MDGLQVTDRATHNAGCRLGELGQSVHVHPPEVAVETETVVRNHCLNCGLIEPPENACGDIESPQFSEKKHSFVSFLN